VSFRGNKGLRGEENEGRIIKKEEEVSNQK